MRKLTKITMVAAFATIAGYGIYMGQESEKTTDLSDLALANVEALAGGEVSITGCQPNGGTCVITIDNVNIVKDDQHP